MDKLIENYKDNLEQHILKCRDDGYYIEAFALIEQLFEQVVKDFLNSQLKGSKLSDDNNMRKYIEILGLLGVIDIGLYNLYNKFKKRRNDLVHKVIYNLDRFDNLREKRTG